MVDLEKGLEYSAVIQPDGTYREMTEAERAAFKPTHVTTYGSKNGVDGAFTTNLTTGETIFNSFIPTNEDILRIWGKKDS